jgi:hypothetical protein
MTFLVVTAFITLAFYCAGTDASTRAKGLFILAFVGSFALLLLPHPYRLAFPLVQCGLAIILGGLTSGLRWLMREV